MIAPPPEIDPNDPTPLYHQVYLLYRQKIVDGTIPHGGRLPSEEMLTRVHGVSRITARRAMNELAQDGLVLRGRGRSTTVAYKAPSNPVPMDFSGLIENLVTIGTMTTVHVLSFEYVPAPPKIADALGLANGTIVQRVQRRRDLQGQPFSHMLTWIPADIGRSFSEKDLTAQPVLSLIEAAGHRIVRARQSVVAHAADAALSQILSLQVGTPLLRICRVAFDGSDHAVQHITVDYRSDAYQLDMVLDRVRDTKQGHNIWKTSSVAE